MSSNQVTLEFLTHSNEFRELTSNDGVAVRLAYATDCNFMNENVYLDSSGLFDRAFLFKLAAEKFLKAIELLKEQRPDCRFVVYDALRPARAQWRLWNKVVGTPSEQYVANPNRGSMHSYGCAIDLSIETVSGNLLDMGTAFDEFCEMSQPKVEEKYFKEGKLSAQALENRFLLRSTMESAGFKQLPHEWWHFDAFDSNWVRANLNQVD